jgi:hypothetical protein
MYNNYLNLLVEKNIKYFYHFTNISNLESILMNGICNRRYMNDNDIKYFFSDKERLDNQINCVSLSLNTINKSMLISKSNTFSNDWIIFEIDGEKVIKQFYNKIYYCKYNAASPSVINMLNKNKIFLKSLDAFNNMFDENNKPHPQCELLLEGNIKFDYVTRIYVNSLQSKLIVQELLDSKGYGNINATIKKEMF